FSPSSLMELPLMTVGALAIRPPAEADWPRLLQLNRDNCPAVARLDEEDLARLVELDGCQLVAEDKQGTIAGYLLSFSSESVYDDSEFRWFRQRLSKPFFYICQVVVAPEYRRRKI